MDGFGFVISCTYVCTHKHTHFVSMCLPCFHSLVNLDSAINSFFPPQYRICPHWKLPLLVMRFGWPDLSNYWKCFLDSSVEDMSVLRFVLYPLSPFHFLLCRCWNYINLLLEDSLILYTHFVGFIDLFTYFCFRCSP